MTSLATQARMLDATRPAPFERLGESIERMIAVQAEAYPSHWTAAERREMAERHLFGGRK